VNGGSYKIFSRCISHWQGQDVRDEAGALGSTLSELIPGTNAIAFNSSLCKAYSEGVWYLARVGRERFEGGRQGRARYGVVERVWNAYLG
jgi:hypothetical protein